MAIISLISTDRDEVVRRFIRTRSDLGDQVHLFDLADSTSQVAAATDCWVVDVRHQTETMIRRALELRELMPTREICWLAGADQSLPARHLPSFLVILAEEIPTSAPKASLAMPVFLERKLKDLLTAVHRISGRDKEDVFRYILEESAALVGAAGGSLFAFEAGMLRLKYAIDPSHLPKAIALPLRQGSPLDRALDLRQPLLISNLDQQTDVLGNGWDGYTDGSLIVLPLLDAKQNVICFISLHNKKQPPFNQQDLELVKLLAMIGAEIIHGFQANQALAGSQLYSRALFDQSPLGLILFSEEGLIVDANQTFMNMLDLQPQTCIGINIKQLTPPKYAGLEHSIITRTLKEDKHSVFEKEFHRHDGQTIPVKMHYGKIEKNGRELVLATVEDTSRIKALEAGNRRYQKQRENALAMESLGLLTGGIAHDFNNILYALLGYADMIRESAHDGEAVLANIEHVLKAAHRARELVRQILLFSRHTKVEKKAVSLSAVVHEAVKLIRVTLPPFVELDLQIQTATPPLFGDSGQIHQVVMNLLSNAVAAMKDHGGRITVEVQEETLDEADKPENAKVGPYAVLKVTDTGKGIAPNKLETIFEPFVTDKEPGHGTGLGLSVVQGIVYHHGGHIDVRSQINRGTCFTLRFPAFLDEETPCTTGTGVVPKGHEFIVFVDDEEELVDMNRMLLRKLGYRCEAFSDPVEAWHFISDHRQDVDLVVTDQSMPVLRGLDLACKIKKISPNLPIVLLTGYCDLKLEKEAQRMGIAEIILKPVLPRDLAEAVRGCLPPA